jgi:hypothetical protein
MGLPVRDTQLHNYGKYLTWPEGTLYELMMAWPMLWRPRRYESINGWWSNDYARLRMLWKAHHARSTSRFRRVLAESQ